MVAKQAKVSGDFQKGETRRTLKVVETDRGVGGAGCVGRLRVWFEKKETVMEERT